jgi:hypothetical protein
MSCYFTGMAKRKKNPHAQAMVKARNRKLTPERRSEIARKAVKARWDRVKAAKGNV